MTKKAYSNDLRSRVIEYIKLGNTQRSAVELFKISKSAVNRWWLRYKNDGVLIAKVKGGSKGKINLSKLIEYVGANPDKTLTEIGKEFGASNCAIHKRLKKLGFSYKKKTLSIWKQIKRKEKPM